MPPTGALDERVLILTPTPRESEVATAILREASVAAHHCASIAALVEQIARGAGLVIIAEEALTPATLPSLAEVLARQPSWSDLPVVLITSGIEDATSGDPALSDLAPLGNVTLLERPLRVMTLLSTVQTALRARRRQYEVRDHLAERKRSEEERERLLAAEQAARAEVEAANRAKDDFLAVLSHELRTPLQAMLGWARALRSGQLDDDTTARGLEAIERNTRTQAQLIEDLLDVSRIVAGKLRIDLQPTLLVPAIETAVDAVRGAAEQKRIRIETEYESRAVEVMGDAGRLQQVIWNLLSNAVKFTPEGGRVDVRLRARDSDVLLTVADTGPGIAPEVLPHIFDRFHQADSTSTRAFGGLGLGLAIVRHLVEVHSGAVEAKSPGEAGGAEFTVTLPRWTGRTEVHGVSTDGHAPLGRRVGDSLLKDLRLLIVDDDADTRELLTTFLENHGAKVTVAASVAEALNALTSLKPDVLITDISMPGEDGYTLVRKIRAWEERQGRHVPSMALTAHVRPEDTAHAVLAGFDAHVAKPVDPTRLTIEIARLAGRAKSGV